MVLSRFHPAAPFWRRCFKVALPIAAVLLALTVYAAYKTEGYIKEKLEAGLGTGVSIGSASLGFRSIDFRDVRMKDASGRDALYVREVSCGFRVFDLLTGRRVIRRIEFKEPELRLAIDPHGKLIGPVLGVPAAQRAKEEKQAPWVLERTVVNAGSLDFSDRRDPHRPVQVQVRDIRVTLDNLALPADGRPSAYELAAVVPGRTGKGTLRSNGRVQFGPNDADGSLKLVNFDITPFEPYFQKDYSISLHSGYLDLDLSASITGGRIKGGGRAVLKDLSVSDRAGAGGQFAGIPVSLLAVFLEKNNHQIPFRFALEGDLKNPAFSLRENLVQGIVSGMADAVGYVLHLPGRTAFGAGVAGLKSKLGRLGERLKKGIGP